MIEGVTGVGSFPAAEVEAGRPDPVEMTSDQRRLWQASQQFEGLFVQHLLTSLRRTVPNGGNPDAPGADLYGSLLDEHLAQSIANDTTSGIADALYRQLTSALRLAADQGEDP